LAASDFPAPSRLELIALPGLPHIVAGDDLASLLVDCLRRQGLMLDRGNVVVLAQKIVSKAEGRLIALADVVPSARALDLARRTGKDPRLVELILSEAKAVVRVGPEVIIVEHRLGFVLANAGVDQSNVNVGDQNATALLLPINPDASARSLRDELARLTGIRVGVVINDSWGRAWRRGTIGHALGVAGVPALLNLRGRTDLLGRQLRNTEVGLADELAAAASLLMGQADEGRPVVLVRGLPAGSDDGTNGASLLRPAAEDLFR
jgi:coenzyme F420-0:L-glutamate ligase / coenzyme F420-1:gamma-L-glutamate ligase